MTGPTPLRLTSHWSDQVMAIGESGMGYSRVRVRLRDGRVFEPVTVVGATLVAQAGNDPQAPIPFTNEDIAAIERL